jgi:hypothetical protein
MRRARLAGVLLATALAGCDASSPGRDAWEAGRRADALAAWRDAAATAGEGASPVLLSNLALAALDARAWDEAEAAARRAAERGGADFAARFDFVRGHVAFARSEAMEAEAGRPDGDATAHERAMAHAEDALAAWRRAATSRPYWPEAARNTERALLRLARLRDRASADRAKKPPPPPPPTPPPVPPPTPEETPGPDARPDADTSELAPADVLRLFDVLRRKEQQKTDLRRAVRHAPSGGTEKDW